jgi:hypothetical protein
MQKCGNNPFIPLIRCTQLLAGYTRTNMSHEITPDNDHLEFLHDKIMKEIEKAISQTNPFRHKENVQTLGLDCVTVAREVYRNLPARNLYELVKGRAGDFHTFGAFPLQDEALKKSVTKIYTQLLEQIDNIPPELLAHIVKSSAEMDNNNKNNIFSINPQSLPFQSKNGDLQPVSTGDKKTGDKLFRAHLCKVQLTAVHNGLQQAISNHYDNLIHTSDEIEEKADALSEINRQIKKLFDDPDNRAIMSLHELLDKETSGLVKREVGIAYLEYLLVNAKKQSIAAQELEKIINNIRWIEDYIHHPDRKNEDCLYQVTDDYKYDLRESLSNADAFKNLPVIGLIAGNLEERSSQTERIFVFGLRFKANNPVTAPDKNFPELGSGMTVYAHHLAKAIKVLELAKQFNTAQGDKNTDYSKLRRFLGRSVRTVFLYYMVFSDHPEKMTWWQKTATMLHKRDPKALDRLLKLANRMLDNERETTNETITPALETLKAVLKNKTPCFKGSRKCLILLDKNVIKNNIDDAADGDIFIKDLANQDINALKKCLCYVRIVKEEKIYPEETLHSIPFNFSFYDNFFYADRQEKRPISTHTQTQTWHFLPVLVRPQIPSRENRDIFHKPLTQTAGLMVQIMPDIKPDQSNTFEFFVYKVTAAVVFILGLSALCQKTV